MIVRDLEDGALEVLAPAKLNLFLEILGKRPDGYHELESLMIAVDLRDSLEFRDDASGGLALGCDDPSLPTDGANLVIRAAQALKLATGTTRGAAIRLRKAIPAQAGLAGGSSDAAATLVALDRLWGLDTSRHGLKKVAASIGSDVAFFLDGPSSVCRGRGEIVEPVASKTPIHLVLVCPRQGVSTAEVYRRITPPESPRSVGEAREALEAGDTIALGRALFNRLQPVAEAIAPGLVTVREAMEALGPSLDGLAMSGSGSAYLRALPRRGARPVTPRGMLGIARARMGPGRDLRTLRPPRFEPA